MKNLKLVSELSQAANKVVSFQQIQELKSTIVNHKKANRINHLNLFILMEQISLIEKALVKSDFSGDAYLTSKSTGARLYLA